MQAQEENYSALPDEASFLASVPEEVVQGIRIAASFLSEVGCSTVGDFRPLQGAASETHIVDALQPNSHPSLGAFGESSEVLASNEGLPKLVAQPSTAAPRSLLENASGLDGPVQDSFPP